MCVSFNTTVSLVMSLWFNFLDSLINQVSHSKNELQPQLIRYDASVDAKASNQSLTFSVNGS